MIVPGEAGDFCLRSDYRMVKSTFLNQIACSIHLFNLCVSDYLDESFYKDFVQDLAAGIRRSLSKRSEIRDLIKKNTKLEVYPIWLNYSMLPSLNCVRWWCYALAIERIEWFRVNLGEKYFVELLNLVDENLVNSYREDSWKVFQKLITKSYKTTLYLEQPNLKFNQTLQPLYTIYNEYNKKLADINSYGLAAFNSKFEKYFFGLETKETAEFKGRRNEKLRLLKTPAIAHLFMYM